MTFRPMPKLSSELARIEKCAARENFVRRQGRLSVGRGMSVLRVSGAASTIEGVAPNPGQVATSEPEASIKLIDFSRGAERIRRQPESRPIRQPIFSVNHERRFPDGFRMSNRRRPHPRIHPATNHQVRVSEYSTSPAEHGLLPNDPSSKKALAKSRSESLGAARHLDSWAPMIRGFAGRFCRRQNVDRPEARPSLGSSIGDFPPIPVRRIMITGLSPVCAPSGMTRRKRRTFPGSRESPSLLSAAFRAQAFAPSPQ